MKTDSNYVFEFAEGKDRERRITNLFQRNGKTKSLLHIEWQYSFPPAGEAITAFAVTKNGYDAAVYSVYRVKYRINNIIIDAAQSLDTLTDTNHRGKFLFTTLAEIVYEECQKQGVQFVFGFPNKFSEPIFSKRLKWESMQHPPYLIYINNLSYPIKKKYGLDVFIPNFLSHTLLTINKIKNIKYKNKSYISNEIKEHEYDLLWHQVVEEGNYIGIDKTSEYISWRYQKKPGVSYSFRSFYVDSKLTAILIYRITNKHGGKIGYIMDYFYLPTHDNKRASSFFFTTIVQEILSYGVDVILAWSSDMKYRRHFFNSGFLKLPRLFQPIKLFYGFRVIKRNSSHLPNSLVKSNITYSNSDTV